MDWVGIVIFILIMVFRALSESEKQKRQREARQAKQPAGRVLPPTPEQEEAPVAPPPIGPIEWELPPIFTFPMEERRKSAETVQEEPRRKQEHKPRHKQAKMPTPAPPMRRHSPVAKIEAKTCQPSRKHPVRLNLDQAVEGVIWSEILQPPRGLRPYGPRNMGRYR